MSIPKQTKVWTCKDGKKVPIHQLTDAHLINIVRMLDRQSDYAYEDAVYSAYSALAFMQGEMAIAAMESEIDHMDEDWDEGVARHPLYDSLMLEIERRGLKV